MTNAVLAGIPGSGASDLAALAETRLTSLGQTVSQVSVEDIFCDLAHELHGLPKEEAYALNYDIQLDLRRKALDDAVRELERQQQGPTHHTIIQVPMQRYLWGAVLDQCFGYGAVSRLHAACGGIDLSATVIDEPTSIARNLAPTIFPDDQDRILDWMSAEITAVENTPCCVRREGNSRQIRKHVIPRPHSDDSLIKLLLDPNPVVTYFGFPITHLKIKDDDSAAVREQKAQYAARIMEFRNRMQDYSVMVVPLEVADARSGNLREKAYTKHRDLNLFIRKADIMISFFPLDIISWGIIRRNDESNKHQKAISANTPK